MTDITYHFTGTAAVFHGECVMDDYRIEAASKAEWAERALRAEAKLDLSEGALDIASRSWGECQLVLEQTEAKLAKLVQAAEPLAKMADRYDPPRGDDDLECWSGLAVPKIKHLRALRTTLASLQGDKT
jgi:hypothetical protein